MSYRSSIAPSAAEEQPDPFADDEILYVSAPRRRSSRSALALVAAASTAGWIAIGCVVIALFVR